MTGTAILGFAGFLTSALAEDQTQVRLTLPPRADQ
jgi:hypothetical protein